MEIKICERIFNGEDIKGITINTSTVLVDTNEEFITLRYDNPNEIKEAQDWLKVQKATLTELREAIALIITTCDFYINLKTQCSDCPLQRKEGCVFTTIPINWRK